MIMYRKQPPGPNIYQRRLTPGVVKNRSRRHISVYPTTYNQVKELAIHHNVTPITILEKIIEEAYLKDLDKSSELGKITTISTLTSKPTN